MPKAIDIRHPYYCRWSTMHQRCYNKRNRNYMNREIDTILIAKEWHRDTPNGLQNFIEWIDTELSNNPDIDPDNFRIQRKKADIGYTPENCHLVTLGCQSDQPKPTGRKFKTDNDSLNGLEMAFGIKPRPKTEEVDGLSMLENVFNN